MLTDELLREIRHDMESINIEWRNVALWLVSLPFFLVGWLVGFIIRCALWFWVALRVGYRTGRGA